MRSARHHAGTLSAGPEFSAVALDRRGGVRIARACDIETADAEIESWLRTIEPDATQRVRALFQEFWTLYPRSAALKSSQMFAAVDLELRKAYAAGGDRPRQMARRIVRRLHSAPRAVCATPADLIDTRLLRFEFGGTPQLGWGERFRLALCAAGALLAAIASVVLVALRREPCSLPPDASTLYAVHAENATRTRGLWRLVQGEIKAGIAARAAVLVLGRPLGGAQSLRQTAAVAAACGVPPDRVQLIRPASLAALLAALPSALAALCAAVSVTAAFARFSGWLPGRKDLTSIYYRIVWGQVHRAWLRRQPGCPERVIFGHSGIGDTTLLEQALQSRGARTVHLLHGAVNGPYLDGISDVAHCQCGADAASLSRWSAYRQARHSPMARPAGAAPARDSQWLLLTNLLHPLAPDFQRFGTRSELLLLDQVAAACRLLDLPAAAVSWKPHPTFSLLPQAVRAAMAAAVRGHGFRQWEEGRPFQDCRDAAVILSTVSTSYLDVLRLGRVAMLYSALPWDRTQFAASLPPHLLAADAAALAALYRRLSSPELHARDFDEAWNALSPGEPDPTLRQILP